MADYTNSKAAPKPYPSGLNDTSRQQLEPLITPDQLKARFLFGIPLYSAAKDPMTGKVHALTDDLIQDILEGAVSTAEQELKITIFPTQYSEKYPFDVALYNSYGHLQLNNKPVISVETVSVRPSNEVDIVVLSNQWIEVAQANLGQISIIPLTVAFLQNGAAPQTSSGGGAFWLQLMGGRSWIPSWWNIIYSCGFLDGFPRIINDYIGTLAAIEILGMLAATYARTSSHSLGIDALSQSASGPGAQIYNTRIEQLEGKKKVIQGKIKGLYFSKIFCGTL